MAADDSSIDFDAADDDRAVTADESLLFQKRFMQDVSMSSGAHVLPSLVTTGSTATFSLEDIVASSSAVPTMSVGTSLKSEAGVSHSFPLVTNESGELMVVPGGNPSPGDLSTDVGIVGQGNQQIIALRLDEATQFLLRQQGITQAVELDDGTFQIIENPVMQIEKEDGTIEAQTLSMEMLQALQGEFTSQLSSVDTGFSSTDATMDQDVSPTQAVAKEEMHDTSEASMEPTDPISSQIKESLEEGSTPTASFKIETAVGNESGEEELGKLKSIDEEKGVGSVSGVMGVVGDGDAGKAGIMDKKKKGTNKKDNQDKDKNSELSSEKKSIVIVVPEKKPDLSNPIPLSDQTIIMVDGKKCVLSFDEETKQVCAYPLKPGPGTRGRGRPRLSKEEKEALAEKRRKEREESMKSMGSEKSSAAETLLELSNTGTDGIRRSGRKRKKAKLFEEYEELEDSSDGEAFQDNQEKDPDINLNLPEIKKKKIEKPAITPVPTSISSMLVASLGTPSPQPIKRKRGRPRRYPPPGQTSTPTSIPAMMIPSENGQTLVMTSLQGFENFAGIQRQLPNLVPKPQAPQEELSTTASATTPSTAETVDATALSLANDSDALPLDTSGALDSNSIIPTALQDDTEPIVCDTSTDNADNTEDNGDNTDNTQSTENVEPSTSDIKQEESGNSTQSTVIQIPDNLLSMFGVRKDPVKIGLKASERELEKLKCPKCDFQGYYTQQYRNHIATHGEDIQKCKCCSYISLDSQELLQHFKDFHPRCICPECGYMAEHAYIIKRHMMRHDTKSCTCNICGKVYKDMYILKMHVKMVHMPAEVLFECNVCSKKFTRKAHLKRHLRIHEPEKPYKCPICEYRGCERSDISKHMLIHEEPKHVCERCGRTFRHIKNKELHVKRHYGQRDYKCGVCDFFGYTFTDIRKHIERKHQDMKMVTCDKCNKHFRTEFALKEHQLSCNVMMIEQVFSIPSTSGGQNTQQATIQIPANLGPEQQIILDGQAITVNGQTIAGNVNIRVTENQLDGLTEAGTEEEEEEEELEDEEASLTPTTMHIIGGESLISPQGGPQTMQIIQQGSIMAATSSELQQMIAAGHHVVQTSAIPHGMILPSVVPGPSDSGLDSQEDGVAEQFINQPHSQGNEADEDIVIGVEVEEVDDNSQPSGSQGLSRFHSQHDLDNEEPDVT